MATITETDLDRIELLARGDGLDLLTTPFDTLSGWLRMECGIHAASHADDFARLLKARAIRRAAA